MRPIRTDRRMRAKDRPTRPSGPGEPNSSAAEGLRLRLDELKQQIAAGTYAVDIRSLAEKLFAVV